MKKGRIILYHGSPTQGIKQFSLEYQRSSEPVEGRGVYLTSEKEVAASYTMGHGSIYKVGIPENVVFDATSIEELRKLLHQVEIESGYEFSHAEYIEESLVAIVDGRGAIFGDYGLANQIRLILSNDIDFMDSTEEIATIHKAIKKELQKLKVIKYIDEHITSTPLYIVKDPSVAEIIDETKV